MTDGFWQIKKKKKGKKLCNTQEKFTYGIIYTVSSVTCQY